LNTPTGLPRKVLLLGSGAICIGQAGEFDYSGTQAIKALKEKGVAVALVNPNIATIQTSEHLADRVYFLPLEARTVEAVIGREKPDGILLGFGGQTALNVGLELDESGALERHGVKVLGTPLAAIRKTEDRERFTREIESTGCRAPRGIAARTLRQARKAAAAIGYPVMCRSGFALGGLGSGVAGDDRELEALAEKALAHSPQMLVEEYLHGWKELEYEVVRDRFDNCVVVCSMENVDPMGIHTGESIVVAPVQTLSADENFRLRSIAIRVIRHFGIIGECNIQFAFDPRRDDYRIIEVNARLSRSSALASKATGYPLAFIAARLALGEALPDIPNRVTCATSACFEPALDYLAVKFPRWDLQKFPRVEPQIGSEMKSVGEVMAIDRGFEAALQKAVRMLDIGMDGVSGEACAGNDLEALLLRPTDKRIFAVAAALQDGMAVKDIHRLTGISPWFLHKIANIVRLEEELADAAVAGPDAGLMRRAKEAGFADSQIARLTCGSEALVRSRRLALGIAPVVRQIDTLAAEYPAQTNYLYLTYLGTEDDPLAGDGEAAGSPAASPVIVLGGGAYRIGSSVEFDWCAVSAEAALRRLGRATVMINCNPETVSTDYDIGSRLYFEELSLERVLDICAKERPAGVIVSMGGQVPNNLALPLARAGVTILGTSPQEIDRAEDRHKFSRLLDELGVDQPEWQELTSPEKAAAFAKAVGYPVLVRPSYVLSGAAMSIAIDAGELRRVLERAIAVSPDHPVVISRFIENAKEIEIDAVAGRGRLHLTAISEHVENAGVHSGDATLVFPPQRTYLETIRRIKIITARIAAELCISGPFNIQFLAKGNEIMVIECNLRASRSFPFVSKVLKKDFIDAAVRAMLGNDLGPAASSSYDLGYVGVKAPQFSFTRLKGSDPVLGVEMSSTGEVACLGDDFNEAFLKSLISVGFRLPVKHVLLSTGPPASKQDFLESAELMAQADCLFFATPGTAVFMRRHGFAVTTLHRPLSGRSPNLLERLASGKIDLVINIPKNSRPQELDNDYLVRRRAADLGIPLITNLQLAKRFAEALHRCPVDGLKPKSWQEYQP
jgi:carbamoyl-phosphate synthase large subunit